MVPTWVQGQDVEKLEVVIDYNSVALWSLVMLDKMLQQKEKGNKILSKILQPFDWYMLSEFIFT
jgi:hypothetical protein